MKSKNNKKLPSIIKDIISRELVKELKLNEVKPFVDNQLRKKWSYPLGDRSGLVYLATNDKRYPTELVIYNIKRDIFHFMHSQMGKWSNPTQENVPANKLSSTHWAQEYFEEWKEDFEYEKGFKENVNEAKDVKSLKSKYDKALKKEQALSSLMLMNLEKYKAAKTKGDEKAIAKFTKIAGQLSKKKRKASDDAQQAYDNMDNAISGLYADAELELNEAASTDPALKSLRTRIPGEKFPELDKWWEYEPEDIMTYVYWHQGELPPTGPKFEKEWKNIVKQLHIKYPIPADAPGHIDNPDFAEGKVNELKTGNKINKARAKAHFKQGENIAVIDKNTGDAIRITDLRQLDAFDSKTHDFAYITEGKLDENTTDGPRYKKYVAKAFEDILGAQFDFRHAMGVKQLTNKDMKLKKKADAIYKAIIDLQKDMRSKGLTEAKLNEADINDPILVAIRARKADLKKKAALPKVKRISTKQYYKLMDTEIDLIGDLKNAYKEYEQLDSDMNQEAGQKGSNWTDADANRYGGKLDKIQTKIEKLAKLKAKVKKAIMNYRIN
jgi:hypothetical protein|tara:strand:- start:4176 stop:5834 length:1659 start_codon:yes stop_codon:yes gene_type:complete